MASLDPAKPISHFIHQTWQTAQGLPQDSVLSIAQTSDGYLWLGTEEGLVRFDGVRFTIFDQHTPGIRNNVISALLVDHEQRLWIGTRGGGLSCLRQGKLTAYTVRNGLPNDSILSLYEDELGNIWVGTDGGGLAKIENGRFQTMTQADGLRDNVVFSLAGDKHGTVWVGTRMGLSKIYQGRVTANTLSLDPGNVKIKSLLVDKAGVLWIGTETEGLYRVSATGTRRYTTANGLTSNAIYSIRQDSAGSIWIGTWLGGLDRLVGDTLSSYREKDGLLGRDVWAVSEDREGNLWVGTTQGLNCLKSGSFTTLTHENGLASDTLLSVYQDRQGALWLGSDQGLTKWDNGVATHYGNNEGLPDSFVFSTTQDGSGAMWIGTRRGLVRLVNGQATSFGAKDGLPNDSIASTYTDRSGNVWVGTRNGLSRFDGHRFITYTTKDGLSNGYVLSIYQSKDGTLWVGTGGGGLNEFRAGHFTAYTNRDGLSSDVVYAITGDDDGTLWLGTNGGGLDRFRAGKFTAYKDLYDDTIFTVVDDHSGHLWMTSNKGVFAASKKQLNDFANGVVGQITPLVYGTLDGMKTRECNGGFQPAGWRLKDGRLIFPTMMGAAIIDPITAVSTGALPQVVIESVSVDNREFDINKSIDVPAGRGKLDFQFTAPAFSSAERIQFRYMLEGFDKEWNEAGTRRNAYYTNIPHGSYRFLVMAGNGQTWGAPRDISLTLQPHFYETTTFYLLAFTAGLGLCVIAYRLRVNHLKMREQKLIKLVNERTSALQESEAQLRRSRDELEHRVEQRTAELVQANQALGEEIAVRRRAEEQLIQARDAAEAASRAKSDFLANMSHEIRTPINGILGMTDLTLSTTLDEEQREYLEIVKFSADSLLAIVNDILDFSKIEARKLNLENVPFQLRTSVNEVVKSVSLRASQKKLSLETEIAADVPDQVIGDPLRLRQVLLNLLDNGIKFTSEGGLHLSIRNEACSESEAVVRFAVTDTGIGISPEKQRTIFEAFSQADTSSTRKYGGTGLGLTISSQLVGMMGGKLGVESRLGSGSTFHFTVRFDLQREVGIPLAEVHDVIASV